MLKETGITIALVIGFVLLITGASFYGLWHYGFFAPKQKAIEREVWENTPSRVHGAVQEIAKRQVEYNNAESDTEKKAICATLRNMYSNLDPEVIDDFTLRKFFKKCKYGG